MSSAQPVMIFHVPFRLNPEAKSASGIRPVKMRQAFEEIGYRVLEVSGTSRDRRAAMAKIKRQVRAGLVIDFVYSEASTQPTAFTDPYFSLHPFFDNNFLAWCRRQGMKVGLFYRDIYWQFPEYVKAIGWFYSTVLRQFYRVDLLGYRRAVDKIYLPSMRMAKSITFIPEGRCEALPPGSDSVEGTSKAAGLNLFYVGGIGSYYRLHEAVKAVEQVPGAGLTICTRQEEWQKERESYAPFVGDATQVVHASGAELEPYYSAAALGCLFLEPIEYREFAAPLKLYEYLGHGKPVIATTGTLAAEFVESNGIGWGIPYESQALVELLVELKNQPQLLAEKTARALEVRQQHTWAARARQVRDGLRRGTK
jgi:glycosyltransferase involved in cell wall biosynthesis